MHSPSTPSHPNALVLKKLYADLASGDFAAAAAACADSFTFQVPGKCSVSGKFDRDAYAKRFLPMLQERSGGTFRIEAHELLASDQHAVALAVERLTRDGKPVEYRSVHVWRFEGGKPVAGYEYPRDLHQFEALWG